jgi:hypothetical protein
LRDALPACLVLESHLKLGKAMDDTRPCRRRLRVSVLRLYCVRLHCAKYAC